MRRIASKSAISHINFTYWGTPAFDSIRIWQDIAAVKSMRKMKSF